MARSIGRALGIGLSANTDKFNKGLKHAESQLDKFKRGVKRMATVATAAFAAAGAASLLYGKMAVEAALEDQKAQKQLALTIKNNTKAHKDLSKAAEKSVEAMQNQFNIADDKLRPAFSKLVTATKSVSKSTSLLRVALNVSAGTGKSLDTVVNALSKAYLGNMTAVGKLGVGINKAELKTMSFDRLIKTVSTTFNGQAKEAANTYAGSVEGIKIAWSEFNESVGYAILPKLKGMLSYIKNDLLPWLGEVKAGFTGAKEETLSPQLRKVSKAMGLDPDKPKSSAYGLGESLKKLAESLQKMFDSLTSTKADGSASTLDQLATSMTSIADAITSVTDAVSGAASWWNKDGFWQNGQITIGNKKIIDVTPWGPKHKATGGPVRRGGAYMVGERGPEMFVPNGQSGRIIPSNQVGGGGNITFNLNGIVDADSARRAIEDVLRNSGKRLGPVNLIGSTL